jgi:hypothetical protein
MLLIRKSLHIADSNSYATCRALTGQSTISVDGVDLLLNTPPGGLVEADLHVSNAPTLNADRLLLSCVGWSSRCRKQNRSHHDVELYVLRIERFKLSDGSDCCYTFLHRSPCRGPGVHDVAMHLQSTPCTGQCVHCVWEKCKDRWKRVRS